jgi:hypothetical protein
LVTVFWGRERDPSDQVCEESNRVGSAVSLAAQLSFTYPVPHVKYGECLKLATQVHGSALRFVHFATWVKQCSVNNVASVRKRMELTDLLQIMYAHQTIATPESMI